MARTSSAPRTSRAPRRRKSSARAIVFHSLNQAIAALRAARTLGVAVELWSAEGAAAYAGAGWFKAAIEEARIAVPGVRAHAVLDCADLPGYALASFRARVEAVCFAGPPSIARKLADIARRSNCRLVRRRPTRALDLRTAEDPELASAAWLASTRSPRPKTTAAARRPPRR